MFEAFGFPGGLALVMFGLLALFSHGNDESARKDRWFGVVLSITGATLVFSSTSFDLERLFKGIFALVEGSVLGVLLWPIMVFGPFGLAFYVFGLIWLVHAVSEWLEERRK